MAQPVSLTIEEIRCFATHDLLGDELVGVMGPVAIELGTFRKEADDGNVLVRRVDISRAVPAGEHFLFVIEKNLLAADTDLGTIDLTQDMGQARRVPIARGSALYEIKLFVQPDVTNLTPVDA